MKFRASFHIYQLVIDDNASGGRHNFLHNQPVGKKINIFSLYYQNFGLKRALQKQLERKKWNFEESQSFESRRIIESRIQLYDNLTTSDWMFVSSIQMKSLTSVLYR